MIYILKQNIFIPQKNIQDLLRDLKEHISKISLMDLTNYNNIHLVSRLFGCYFTEDLKGNLIKIIFKDSINDAYQNNKEKLDFLKLISPYLLENSLIILQRHNDLTLTAFIKKKEKLQEHNVDFILTTLIN